MARFPTNCGVFRNETEKTHALPSSYMAMTRRARDQSLAVQAGVRSGQLMGFEVVPTRFVLRPAQTSGDFVVFVVRNNFDHASGAA